MDEPELFYKLRALHRGRRLGRVSPRMGRGGLRRVRLERVVPGPKSRRTGSASSLRGASRNFAVPTRDEATLASPHGAGREKRQESSCACGGDARTDPFCAYQRDTTFLFRHRRRRRRRIPIPIAEPKYRLFGGAEHGLLLRLRGGAREVNMHVREYGGIPDTGRPACPS